MSGKSEKSARQKRARPKRANEVEALSRSTSRILEVWRSVQGHNCRVILSCAGVSEFVELVDFTIISRTERQNSNATSHHIIGSAPGARAFVMRLFTRSNFSVLCDITMITATFEQLRHANPRESGASKRCGRLLGKSRPREPGLGTGRGGDVTGVATP